MRRIQRLPPRGIPRDFYLLFPDVDMDAAQAVAEFVDRERRRVAVDVALIEVGDGAHIPGFACGLTKGYKYLRAGRYILHRRERRSPWQSRRGR